MQELTQCPEQKPGLSPEKTGAPILQNPDFENDKSPQLQRPKDILSQLSYIEEDMKGVTGQLGGLFGM